MEFYFLLLAAVTISLALRIQEKNNRSQAHQLPEHTKPSPVSQALQEMVATAGGIYLSLVLLASFLQLDLEEKWLVLGTKMEPLAFVALALTLLQPVFLRAYRWIKGVW